jgi:hypothetical protein
MQTRRLLFFFCTGRKAAGGVAAFFVKKANQGPYYPISTNITQQAWCKPNQTTYWGGVVSHLKTVITG